MRRILLVFATLAALLGAPRAAGASPAPESHRADVPATWTLWGTTYCLPSAPADARCDVRLGGPAAAAASPRPIVLTVFGKTVCAGRAPAGVRCDIALGAPAPSRTARSDRRTGDTRKM